MTIQVRLKPHDPAKGHVLRSLTITALGGLVFEEGKVVDRINDAPIDQRTADVLRTVTMRPGEPDLHPNAPLAFDVLEESAMKSLLASEAKQKLGLTPELMAALKDEFAKDEQPPVGTPPAARPRRPRSTAGAGA